MTRDPRYDVLFEPVKIGPKVARNRFYQVPHCNGMGRNYPASLAEMRGVKAEGGWAVVCTEEVELHYSSDITPYNEGRLWDDCDMPALALMAEKVHEHGSLAGIELVYQGPHARGYLSKEPPMGPSCRPNEAHVPGHARAMDKQDIRDLRRWHKNAVKRSLECGFDLIYTYCAHDLTIQMHFLSLRYNDRTDEYGGSLENRVRLFRETLEDTLELCEGKAAVPVRFAVDEMMGEGGMTCENEGRDVIEMLAELPDLWDVNVSNWDNDSQTSRFSEEGFQEPFIKFVKSVTTKPVVAVGRYTSADRMVSLVNKGVLDMIGAARPSIADPFLPKKIEEGRIEDIRECIGCNVCVTGDHLLTPMTCTQNATMSEEWRRGWHPEKFAPRKADEKVLVIGAGPAGMEAARVLGERGYETVLAEATEELGGRVARECKLPGLSAWGRVADYREGQIRKMTNVDVYRASDLSVEQVLEFGFAHVAVATGATWRRDGVGLSCRFPVAGLDGVAVMTPDDIMGGAEVSGSVVIWDDDNYYMGGVLAEKLRADGADVTILTASGDISGFTHNSLEQHRVQKQIMEMGIDILPLHALDRVEKGEVVAACNYTGRKKRMPAGTLVMVTAMLPNDGLYLDLKAREADWADAGIKSVERIGDALAPSIIAHAVWHGHRYGREVGEIFQNDVPRFKREINTVGGA